MAQTPRTWMTLSRSALQHNLQALRRVVGPKIGILPILKANAYGHGLAECWPLLNGPIRGIGVAYGQEALQLRTQGFRGSIIVLSAWETSDLNELIKKKIELVVWDNSAWERVNQAAKKTNSRAKIHLKLDTGTTRIGFLGPDVSKLQDFAKRFDHTHVAGVFSHLANSEEAKADRTIKQINYFTTLEKQLKFIGGERHLACSAAAIRYPGSHRAFIRPGIGVYGLWPSLEIQQWSRRHKPNLRLKPVLQWKTKLLQVKRIPAGTAIGYGSTVRVKQPTRIGILPVGYSDGYPRAASNKSWVMLGRKRAPVLGRISMNLMTINVKDVPGVKAGDPVDLIGPGISADQLAQASRQINYEIIAQLNPGIPRIVIA